MKNFDVKYILIAGAISFAIGFGLLAWATSSCFAHDNSQIKRPNIVFILADDLGIECLSSYGSISHNTPNLDKLATQGMRFTNCFSNPYCSPSRASLLTGPYPFKNGLKEVLSSTRQEDIYLSPDQPSFARQLNAAGYATAIAGKWHVSLLHKHNTILIFLADNGTDRELNNSWGDGKTIAGGKGTMTDRGTHVPMIVRWPKHIRKGSTNNDLIDFSDIFPTMCDLAGVPLPTDKIHGRSFLPQFLGQPGNPREWVHVQDKEERHIRNWEYILNNKNELRSVVEIWEAPAKPNQNKYPEKERAARKTLHGVFDFLEEEEYKQLGI